MAWVTPSSRSTGDLITAAIWNQDVVANPIATAPITKGDLVAGDDSAPAQLTVGSDGERLEADSGEATGLKWVGGPLIDSQVLSGAVATITFANIPGTYRSLELHIYARSSASATNDGVDLTFNNDTGNNYDRISATIREADSFVASETFAAASLFIGSICGDTSPADAFDLIIVTIPNYAGAVGEKVLRTKASNKRAESSTDLFIQHGIGYWRSTAPITEIDLVLAAGNFKIGSSFSLYGW